MDRTLVGSLLRSRHLAATFAIFLALGGLAGLVVGAATAAGEDAPATTFTFATPQVGDRGHYEVSGGVYAAFGQTGIDFEMLEDASAVDRLGQERAVNRVGVLELPGDDDRFHDASVYQVDPRTGETLAVERAFTQNEADGDRVRSRQLRAVDFNLEGNGWEPPCGLRNELQGTTWDLEPVVAVFPCQYGQGPMNAGPWVWTATGVAKGPDGIDHLRVRIDWAGATRMELEYRSDLPYPVLIKYGYPSDDDRGIATLSAFERGSGPAIALAGTPPGPAVPQLELKPRTAWLLDDTGLDHPFPMSKAWQLALDDPDPAFRDFLADHPDAYVAFAAFHDFRSEEEGNRRSWRFEVTDARAALDVSVSEPVIAVDEAPDPMQDPVLAVRDLVFGAAEEEEPSSNIQVNEGQAGDAVDPSVLPAQFPSVASMMTAWQRHAGPAYDGVDGNYWRVDVLCGETCKDIDLRLTVGHAVYVRDGEEDTYTESSLEWIVFPARGFTLDSPSRYSEDVTNWGPATPATASPSGYEPASFRGFSPDLWIMPGGKAAAGVGASAALVALAYWLWPLAKGGGIGLFSRVHKDRLLDNPLRTQLVTRIEAEPGIHHNALVRDLGKGKGAAEHHLDKLVAARLVLRHRSPGYTCYFPVGTDARGMAGSHATKSLGARRILQAIANGLSGVREVAAATGMAPSTVSHHLERLRAAGLVTGNGQTGYHAVLVGSSAGQAAA